MQRGRPLMPGYGLEEGDAHAAKYHSGTDVGGSAIVRVTPREIFAIEEARFIQTPTRWRIDLRGVVLAPPPIHGLPGSITARETGTLCA